MLDVGSNYLALHTHTHCGTSLLILLTWAYVAPATGCFPRVPGTVNCLDSACMNMCVRVYKCIFLTSLAMIIPVQFGTVRRPTTFA